eukprot:1140734-Pelagomonas_calceolata.AAC.4
MALPRAGAHRQRQLPVHTRGAANQGAVWISSSWCEWRWKVGCSVLRGGRDVACTLGAPETGIIRGRRGFGLFNRGPCAWSCSCLPGAPLRPPAFADEGCALE